MILKNKETDDNTDIYWKSKILIKYYGDFILIYLVYLLKLFKLL
jgi:hypothetical protein